MRPSNKIQGVIFMGNTRRKNDLSHENINSLTAFKNVTLEDSLRLFLQDCELRNLSNRTVGWYRGKINTFFKRIDKGIKTVNDINAQHIKDFMVAYKKEGWEDSTINGMLRAIRPYFNYCYSEGLINEDIGAGIKLYKEKVKVIETFSREQIKKLLRQPDLKTFVGLRDATIMMLLLDTGMRISELTGINVYDINWWEGFITVNGKGNKQRQVPVQITTLKQLEKYYRVRGEMGIDAFFVTVDNTRITVRHLQDRIKDFGDQAGIKHVRVSPHTFRHTFAKMYIQNGGDVFTLQKILGHTTLEMVRRYVDMFSGEVRAAHKKFSPIENLLK